MSVTREQFLSPARAIANTRPEVDWNTCGQAAIATVLAHFRVGPFAAEPEIDDGAAIDRVRERFGPDVPLGLGTSAFRIQAALKHYGLQVRVVRATGFGDGIGAALDALRVHLARGIPAPVCLDDGVLGGRPWSAHWAVARRIEDARITLGNAGVRELALDRFLAAWRCPHLPWPHQHCAVLASR